MSALTKDEAYCAEYIKTIGHMSLTLRVAMAQSCRNCSIPVSGAVGAFEDCLARQSIH